MGTEELAQILLLCRPRNVGDVELALVRVRITPALLARRVRDLGDESVAGFKFAAVQLESSLRVSLFKTSKYVSA